MNFSDRDVHRSLRRYVAVLLGEDWKTYAERRVIGDDERPACVVEPSAARTQPFARAVRPGTPQGDVEAMQTFAIQAYPPLFDTAQESAEAAAAVCAVLLDAISYGAQVPGATVLDPPVDLGGPLAIPVWDYAGVPVVGEDRGGPEDPYGHVHVRDHSGRPIQDPLDQLRFTVAISVRCWWERAGRDGAEGPLAASMRGRYVITEP